MITKSIALVIALCGTPAFAQDWVYIGGNESIKAYVERQSIKRAGETEVIGLMEIRLAPPTNGSSKNGYSVQRVLNKFNCDKGTFILLETFFYDGDRLVGQSKPQNLSPIHTQFGSLNFVAAEHMCNEIGLEMS